MKANIEFRKIRDFGEIISDCIMFIRQNWKSLVKTYFVFCGIFIAGNLVFSLLEHMKVINIRNAAIAGNPSSTGTAFGLEYFMVIIFSFLNIVSATLCILSYVTLYNQKGNKAPTISEVWGYYKYYFWRVVWHSILLMIIFIMALFIVAVPISLIFGSISSFIVPFVILICVLVPLLYYASILSLFFPIVIIENGGFGYAFSKCFKLVKGKWWNTFGVVIVIAVIVYATFLLVIIPFSVASGGVITFLSFNASLPVVIIYTVIMSFIQVINILPWSAFALTYFSYIEDKESIGLLERIDTLGRADEITDTGNEAY